MIGNKQLTPIAAGKPASGINDQPSPDHSCTERLMSAVTQVYVYLLDEGTDVWRPVDAIPVGGDIYKIVAENHDPEDEHWEFATGDEVRCEARRLSSGMHLVAVARAERKIAEQGAAPNGSPATQCGNSKVSEGPLSVS